MPFMKNRRRAMEMNSNFISLIRLKDTMDMKKSRKESPAVTMAENSNISFILTPPFLLSAANIKILLDF